MNSVVVSLDDVFFLFKELVGGADIDDIFDGYGGIDLTNEADRSKVIHDCIKPVFELASDEQKRSIKRSLAYFALFDTELVLDKSDFYLFPFDFPSDTASLLKQVWKELFPGEELKFLERDVKVV